MKDTNTGNKMTKIQNYDASTDFNINTRFNKIVDSIRDDSMEYHCNGIWC